MSQWVFNILSTKKNSRAWGVKEEHSFIIGGTQTGSATIETNVENSQNYKNRSILWSSPTTSWCMPKVDVCLWRYLLNCGHCSIVITAQLYSLISSVHCLTVFTAQQCSLLNCGHCSAMFTAALVTTERKWK